MMKDVRLEVGLKFLFINFFSSEPFILSRAFMLNFPWKMLEEMRLFIVQEGIPFIRLPLSRINFFKFEYTYEFESQASSSV